MRFMAPVLPDRDVSQADLVGHRVNAIPLYSTGALIWHAPWPLASQKWI